MEQQTPVSTFNLVSKAQKLSNNDNSPHVNAKQPAVQN